MKPTLKCAVPGCPNLESVRVTAIRKRDGDRDVQGFCGEHLQQGAEWVAGLEKPIEIKGDDTE